MTREEFVNDITEWDELIEFCSNEELNSCDDIMSGDAILERIDDDIRGFLYWNRWQDLRDTLNELDIDQGLYYRWDSELLYERLDDYDFDRYKSCVLAEMEGYWDEDDSCDSIEEPIVNDEDDEFEVAEEEEMNRTFGYVKPVLIAVDYADKVRTESAGKIPATIR